MNKQFPVIDPVATGQNILRLRMERGLSVRDLQSWFGFEEPQAIYKWQKGKSLPTVDNLYALGTLLDVPMEEILVPRKPQLNIVNIGRQESSCCPIPLSGCIEYGRSLGAYHHLLLVQDGWAYTLQKSAAYRQRVPKSIVTRKVCVRK